MCRENVKRDCVEERVRGEEPLTIFNRGTFPLSLDGPLLHLRRTWRGCGLDLEGVWLGPGGGVVWSSGREEGGM